MSYRIPLAHIQFISSFAAFCRTKGDKRYDPSLSGRCALAQFGHSRAGLDTVPRDAFKAATGFGLTYTFSALADRLEALIVDAPVVGLWRAG